MTIIVPSSRGIFEYEAVHININPFHINYEKTEYIVDENNNKLGVTNNKALRALPPDPALIGHIRLPAIPVKIAKEGDTFSSLLFEMIDELIQANV